MPEPPEDSLYYPLVMTTTGAVPQSPLDLRAQLINLVTFGTDKNGTPVLTPVPGYTANLPGSLIEDISSTDTAALVICDQARVELINSLTPFGANAFILNQLGQLLGIPIGTQQNVTVGVVFSGPPGLLVQRGFMVGDGSHSYTVQQTVTLGVSGFSPSVPAIATVSGSWAVPSGTVTTIQTSLPATIQLAVTNPNPGTGGTQQETEQQYRLRVMQAERVTCQGTPDFLKTLLMAIPGVSPQQVAIQAATAGNWRVIVGGSTPDPFAIANAIYQGIPMISNLVGSAVSGTRDTVVTIDDFPDGYDITWVTPVKQTLTVNLVWNATSTLASVAAISQLAQTAIINFVNATPCGAPVNQFAMEENVFDAVEQLVNTHLISVMDWTYKIDGVDTAPGAGTGIVEGDTEGYFVTDQANVTVAGPA
jgi:hypothetical protein